MAIYVDPMVRVTFRSFGWRASKACHLYADTLDELHQFAAEHLELKPEWFKNQSDLPHYLIVSSKRKSAIKAGAIETTRDHLAKYVAQKQKENRKRKGKGK